MPIESVKIPQNVYVEERIIGPVTLRQIIIMMIGAGVSYAIFSGLKAAGSANIVSTILAWTPALIAAAFAFVKINDISLFRMLFLMIEKSQKPAIRIWEPRRGITINIALISPQEKSKEQTAAEVAEQEKARSSIKELSALLDSQSAPMARKEAAAEETAAPEEPGEGAVPPAGAATGEAGSRNPVRTGRVTADALEQPIDAVREADAAPAAPGASAPRLLRDVLPPSSSSHG